MFRGLYEYNIVWEILISYVELTKLIKWKHLYMWLLQIINILKTLKHCKIFQVAHNSENVCLNTVT